MSFSWPLMKDIVTDADRRALSDFVLTTGRLTNGPRVREFESAWSEWQGCDYSLFVSSGSTANSLLVAAAMQHYGLTAGNQVAVPAITWATNIGPVIQNGLTPVFCDVCPKSFAIDPASLRAATMQYDIKAVFVTHLFGIPAPMAALREALPRAVFLEDVCESHGAVVDGVGKAGNFSAGGTFSFYFGHHMTTIEGGMVCVSDAGLYDLMRAKRSHGLAREMAPQTYARLRAESPDVNEQFLFGVDGYNFRNTEIGAVLGMSQLARLDAANARRREVFDQFVNMTWRKYPDVFESFNTEGNSSFCLPFVCKSREVRVALQKFLDDGGVETRPLCGGNLLRQPFLRGKYGDASAFAVADFLHFHGFFIGNNHLITDDEIAELESRIDGFVRDLPVAG